MKILYSHRTRSRDGQHVHIRELTNALGGLGHKLAIVGPRGADHLKAKLGAGGGHGFRRFVPAMLYEAAEFSYSAPAYIELARRAKAARPDILYERYNLYYHAGAWLKKQLDIPMILEVNAPLVKERSANGELSLKTFGRLSEQSIWRAADMVLPVTNVLAENLRSAGVQDEKICIIPNGVSKEFLAPRNPNLIREKYNLQGKIVLGFTGFVRDWHRVDRAIQFLAIHPREDLHLMIVGDGPARQSLEMLAEVLGVNKRVIFTGVVQRNELPDYVAAFDVGLQPAVVDYASPLKLFEYMALGLPILAPDSANIREILTHNNDAILFSPESQDEFEKSLLSLIEDVELRNRLGMEARTSLERKDLTWVGNAARIATLAEGLLKEKHDCTD